MLELDDRGDLRKAIDPFDERVFDDLAEMPRKAEKLLRRQVLIAKENQQVVEPGAPEHRNCAAVEIFSEIDPADLGSRRPGDRADLG
jgi:hypothetical protein